MLQATVDINTQITKLKSQEKAIKLTLVSHLDSMRISAQYVNKLTKKLVRLRVQREAWTQALDVGVNEVKATFINSRIASAGQVTDSNLDELVQIEGQAEWLRIVNNECVSI